LAIAMVWGGPSAPLPEHVDTTMGLGLDWFVLNLLVLAALFVPLERAKPHRPAQLVFREGWTIDGVHFLVSHLLVQLVSFVALTPAALLKESMGANPLRDWLQSWPLAAQFVLIVIVADFTQYFVHRAFHQVPWLWNFHAVHHSSPALDWLAGSRLHLFDALVTRAIVLTPLVWLGFSQEALAAYLIFVSFHAVFIHANWGARLGWLEPFLVTPRIHHFHHASEAEAVDKNFAVHLPLFDRLFGTRYAPTGQWPKGYGIEGCSVPVSYWGQLLSPFRRR
jgi:lathosterol oxidase